MKNQGDSILSKKIGLLSKTSSGYDQKGKVGGNRVPWLTSARQISESYLILDNGDFFDLENGDGLILASLGV